MSQPALSYHSIRSIAKNVGWLLLALAVALTGCSLLPYTPSYLVRVSAPHLRWLSALSRIPQSDGTKGGDIEGLTMFQRPGAAIPHAIVQINEKYYLIGEDGSDTHTLNIGSNCAGSALVSPDSKWISCYSYPDINTNANDIQIAALNATGVSQPHLAGLYGNYSYSNASWSPDGQYLAAYAVQDDGWDNIDIAPTCQPEVDIFYFSASHASLKQVIVLRSDLITSSPCAFIQQIQWTSNTQLLIVLNKHDHTASPTTWEAQVSVATALKKVAANLNTTQEYQLPVSLSIPPQQFKEIYDGVSGAWNSDMPDDQYGILMPPLGLNQRPFDPQQGFVIALSSVFPEVIYRVDLRTGFRTPLFALADEEYVREFGWTPDGRDLFVVVSGQRCIDCSAPVSDVYLYSLDTAG
jgi:hypothetical protein